MNGHTRLAALLALAALALPASAKTYYVDPDGNDDNTGLSQTAAFKTIQGAIDKAAAGSTILVAPGTYAPIRTSKKLTIKSIDGAEETIIDGSFGEHYVAPAVAVPDGTARRWDVEISEDEFFDEETYPGGWKRSNGNRFFVELQWLPEDGGDPPDGGFVKPGFRYGTVTLHEEAGEDPWEEWIDWIPPFDEGLWTGPVKSKTTKSRWGKRATRSGLVRCTEACAMLGALSHVREIDGDGTDYYDYRDGTNFVSAAATISGFTLRNAQKGVWGGSASHCVVTGINGQPVAICSLSDSEIVDNDAHGFIPSCGGALASASALTRCEIHDNRIDMTSPECDGISDNMYLGNSSHYKNVPIMNCLIYRNDVNDDVRPQYSSEDADRHFIAVDLYNCTVVGNTLAVGPCVGFDTFATCASVYNSILLDNVNGSGEQVNVKKVVDEKTGNTVADGFMNYTKTKYKSVWVDDDDFGHYEDVPEQVDVKAVGSMMYSLTDMPIEQKGNGKGWMTSGGGSWHDPVWKYRVTYKNSTGNITGDPLFIDPLHGDYHLAPTSPCKDAGADYTKKTGKFDLDSGARKVGKVDMGAYELQPQTAVPADYDGDGKTDAAFYFAASGQWWIFQSRDGLRTISLPDRNAVPCPADYDDEAGAEPAYFSAAAKEPAFVRVSLDGEVLERTAFGAKGATPVAAKLDGAKATFGVYTANAKKPEFAFQNGRILVYGAKASRPVAADFDKDGKDDLGVYTATASKPAFSILQSSQGYATTKLFQGGPVALGAKGAIPCCADFDGDGQADFATYLSNAKAPYFTRLPSTTQYRETRILPMGSKGDVPVVGVYETEHGPAAPAVWTGTKWTYVKSDYTDDDVRLLGD